MCSIEKWSKCCSSAGLQWFTSFRSRTANVPPWHVVRIIAFVSKHRCSSHLKLFAFYALLPLFDCISAYGSSRLHTPFAAEKEVILFHTLLLNKGATNAAISRSALHFLLFNLPYVVVSLKMEMCVAAVLVIDVDAGPQLKIFACKNMADWLNKNIFSHFDSKKWHLWKSRQSTHTKPVV